MELRRYLRVIALHRRVAALAFLVTSLATFVLALSQPAVYESTGTALIHPRLRDQGDAIDASDLLIRGVKIAETYASVARSTTIRERAEDALAPDVKSSGITVAAQVVTDTNILSISARGHDPVATRALSAAVMDATVDYSITLSDAYVLSPLDQPEVADAPVGPNTGITIVLGLIFGLLLAAVSALFAEYLRGGMERLRPGEDERTGLRNEDYLSTRLWEEMSRADRTGRTFALVSFRVGVRRNGDDDGWRPPSDPDLRRIGELLPLTIPSEVVIAHLGDGEFGAILPDMERPLAYRMLARWEAGINAVLDGHAQGVNTDPRFAEGVCQYRNRAFDGEREAVRLARQLTDREVATVVRARARAAGPEEAARHEPARPEPARHEPARPEPARHGRTRHERVRHERLRHEPARPEAGRQEPARPEAGRQEPARPEAGGSDNGSRRGADVEVVLPDVPETRTPGRPQARPSGGGNRRSKASKGKPRAANRRR